MNRGLRPSNTETQNENTNNPEACLADVAEQCKCLDHLNTDGRRGLQFQFLKSPMVSTSWWISSFMKLEIGRVTQEERQRPVLVELSTDKFAGDVDEIALRAKLAQVRDVAKWARYALAFEKISVKLLLGERAVGWCGDANNVSLNSRDVSHCGDASAVRPGD